MFRYQKVYGIYKEKILNGSIKGGSLLPSENTLANEFDVDRSTIRRALQMLVDDGLVEKSAGKGTIVIGRNLASEPGKAAIGTNKNIGFLLPSGNAITEQFYSLLFYELEQILQRHSYSLIYSTLDSGADLSDTIRSLNLVGCAFVSNVDQKLVQEAIALDFPCIMLNSYSPLIPSVLTDNEEGGYLAGRYLCEKGHRRFFLITGVRSYTTNQERLDGFRRAMHEYGISESDYRIGISESWERDGGEKCVAEYLRSEKRIASAMFAFNDRLAYGAIKAISNAGLSVPEDISVVGFDNLNASLGTTELTSIEAHVSTIAEGAAQALLWQISGGRKLPMRIDSPVELIEGSTVKAI